MGLHPRGESEPCLLETSGKSVPHPALTAVCSMIGVVFRIHVPDITHAQR